MRKKKSSESALHEVEGIKQPASVSDNSIKNIKLKNSTKNVENKYLTILLKLNK